MNNRRQILASIGAVAALAGCSGSERGDDTTNGDNGDSELDLREANVVSVEIDDAQNPIEFAVGLHHDDDGEDGYANWWQVESLDGTQLGRRELTHPHSQQPFTRSTTIEIPESVACVVVRGHDQIHGYGGQLIVVNIDTGNRTIIEQGSDRQEITRNDCG